MQVILVMKEANEGAGEEKYFSLSHAIIYDKNCIWEILILRNMTLRGLYCLMGSSRLLEKVHWNSLSLEKQTHLVLQKPSWFRIFFNWVFSSIRKMKLCGVHKGDMKCRYLSPLVSLLSLQNQEILVTGLFS